MLISEPVTNQCGMSGGRHRPPMEEGQSPNGTDFRVPSATSNWLRTTYQIDNAAGGTTTTTRHFAAWEQTTHFPRGHHTHPLLAASASLNSSPLIRPIPNRLASPPRSPLTSEAKSSLASPQGLNLVKLESRLHEVDTDGNDSAFEDWESCSRTTPNNHKSIRKWRQQSQPGGGRGCYKPPSASSTPSSMPALTPISILTSSPLEANGGGPLSAPSVIHSWPHEKGAGSFSPSDSLFTSPASSTSNSDLKRRLKSETVTSPESVSSMEDNKPIGIAVGRQRTPTTSMEGSSLDSGHETSTDKSSFEDSGIELKRPAPAPAAGRTAPVSGLLPPLSPLDCMIRPPHYWPLPYVASPPAHQPTLGSFPVTTKDLYPMYLYNGFGPLAAASMWPPPSSVAASAAAYGATPFQQSLIQLQQESWLARQNGFLFNQQPPQESPSPPRRPQAPPPIVRSPSPVSPKANGHDHEDNVSVGGPSDEIEDDEPLPANNKSDLVKVKVESLKAEKSEDDTSGLQLLTEGIDRLEHTSSPKLKPPQPPASLRRPSKLGMLCDAAFLSDDEGHMKSDSINSESGKVRSRSLDSGPNKKPRTLSSEYRSPKAERNAKAFIASKSLKVSEDLNHLEGVVASSNHHENNTNGNTVNTVNSTSGSEVNVPATKMADWERNLRLNLADIQKKYKEKYKELQVINKKSFAKTPKKLQDAKKTLAPITPWLHKLKNGQHAAMHNAAGTDKKSNKPELLSSKEVEQKSSGPDLSTITSKFRSARPNPFENLLKLSCVGKKNQDGVKKTEQEMPEPASMNESPISVLEDHDVKKDKLLAIFATSTPKVEKTNGQDLKSLPKLQLANNEVEDHADADVSEVEEEEEEEDMVEEGPPVLEPMLVNDKPKNNITVKIKRPSETDSSSSVSRPKKSKKEKKSKKAKKERHHHHSHHHKKHHHVKPSVVHFNDNDAEIQAIDLVDTGTKIRINKKKKEDWKKPVKEIFIEGPETCLIKENDLVDGLRVLVKLEGHFHPGKIQAISPPDIYGVLVDKERGNKPHIFSREEVLQEAIFEVKPPSVEALTIGTRVCAYWSQKYNHLYPGTISDMDIDPKLDSNFVNVELDDGDNRDIHVNSIRYLPPQYPLVVYDPDPLMTTLSRRKRRQSWESGTSDGSRATKTPRASIDEPQPLQPPKTHVHSGDLKMRINVSQSKQKKTNSGSQQNSTSAAKVVRKTALAQRPSISSSSDDEGKCGIASFLPKDQVWKWADKGQKRAKGRTYHKVIQRKGEKLCTGDSAVFLSTNCPDQPYIGRLEYMWETASGAKNVAVRWYYHLAEVECAQDADRKNLKKLKQPKGALFESNHYDENDVQTISHRCDVLSFNKFKESGSQTSGNPPDSEEDSNDKYYLAGSHNAVEKTVQFSPGVLLT